MNPNDNRPSDDDLVEGFRQSSSELDTWTPAGDLELAMDPATALRVVEPKRSRFVPIAAASVLLSAAIGVGAVLTRPDTAEPVQLANEPTEPPGEQASPTPSSESGQSAPPVTSYVPSAAPTSPTGTLQCSKLLTGLVSSATLDAAAAELIAYPGMEFSPSWDLAEVNAATSEGQPAAIRATAPFVVSSSNSGNAWAAEADAVVAQAPAGWSCTALVPFETDLPSADQMSTSCALVGIDRESLTVGSNNGWYWMRLPMSAGSAGADAFRYHDGPIPGSDVAGASQPNAFNQGDLVC